MSAEKCAYEIEDFLASDQARVLVISGKWGVGKTFAWNYHLQRSKNEKQIEFSRYTYASLFGIGSLKELKEALFHGARPVEEIGKDTNLKSLEGTVKAVKANWNKAGILGKMLPQTEGYASFVSSIGYLLLNKHIVCIDDIERRGKSLELTDILGLVSQLKEEKQCKVVLLLNDKELGDAEDQFFSHLEKVADATLSFEPTASEAAEIALDQMRSYHARLRECCVELGIVNIRTIKKIEAALIRIESELAGSDPRLLEQAAHSLTLFFYCRLHPSEAPTLDFVRNKNPWDDVLGNGNAELPHADWRDLLGKYGFGDMDEFDALLADGVTKGYFDFDGLRKEAEKLSKIFLLRDQDNSFSEAWDFYYESFDNNADDVISRFVAAVEKTPKVISPTNLSGTISVLKELGWQGDFKKLVESYVSGRDEQAEFWNLDEQTFGGEVKDEDVRTAFKIKFESFPDPRNLADILISWGGQSGYNLSDVDFVATFDENAFYDLFKKLRGKDLRRAVKGALWFRNSNEEKQRKIAEVAEASLIKIGSESAINRRRVMQHGVKMPQ